MKQEINLEKEFPNILMSGNIKLNTINTKESQDPKLSFYQETVSIGKGGSGNVAMSREDYTKDEIETHNKILELIHL